MRTERFTTRATEAINAAQQLAEGEGHPELTAQHLLLSLVDQPDGVVPAVIERLGQDPAAVAGAVRAAAPRGVREARRGGGRRRRDRGARPRGGSSPTRTQSPSGCVTNTS